MKFATKNRLGFTLIEVVLTIVIISTGLFGMMILFDNVTKGAMEGDLNLSAVYLAREKLEQIVYDKVYKNYDNVIMSRYSSSENVSLNGNNYIRDLNIYEVDKSDLATPVTPPATSGFKRVDVTIRWGTAANQRLTETTLITR